MTQAEYELRKRELIVKVNQAVMKLRTELKLDLEKLEIERQKSLTIDK